MEQLTYGEKSVGLSFNPGNNEKVDHIKRQCADVVDNLNILRERMDNQEVKHMLSIAITEIQTAQMWAVKAVTWQH